MEHSEPVAASEDIMEIHDESLVENEEIVLVTYVVEPNYAGWRLDKYLSEKIQRLSRTRIQRIIERSLVSDRKLKASTSVWPGLTFQLKRRFLPEPTVPPPEALGVVFLDDALLVIDKPAGLPIHPTARYHHGTLVSQLKVKFGPDFQAHPAHRIDRETSGLLVCGRTLAANQSLMRGFSSGSIQKEYLAIVEGHVRDETFTIDAPIAEGTELIRVAVRIDRQAGKPARTDFQVLKRFERDGASFSLLRCRPQTGRQHQIRIHAQCAGFSLVGDKMYGPDPQFFDRFSKGCLEPEAWQRLRLSRHALHAAAITLMHPVMRKPVTFESPLPSDMAEFVFGGVFAHTSPY